MAVHCGRTNLPVAPEPVRHVTIGPGKVLHSLYAHVARLPGIRNKDEGASACAHGQGAHPLVEEARRDVLDGSALKAQGVKAEAFVAQGVRNITKAGTPAAYKPLPDNTIAKALGYHGKACPARCTKMADLLLAQPQRHKAQCLAVVFHSCPCHIPVAKARGDKAQGQAVGTHGCKAHVPVHKLPWNMAQGKAVSGDCAKAHLAGDKRVRQKGKGCPCQLHGLEAQFLRKFAGEACQGDFHDVRRALRKHGKVGVPCPGKTVRYGLHESPVCCLLDEKAKNRTLLHDVCRKIKNFFKNIRKVA